MRILVYGHYAKLNAGDDRMQQCLTLLLGAEHELVFASHSSPAEPSFIKSFDWVLIGGGGLVHTRVGIWSGMGRWLGAGPRIGVLGLGVNHLPTELAPELEALLQRAEFFFVRDEPSRRLLGDDPRVEKRPDLTWLFPFARVRPSTRGVVALNLAPTPWKPYDAHAWARALEGRDVAPLPMCFMPGRDADLLGALVTTRPTPREFSLDPLLEAETLVAARFHAVVFALQLGTPFVAIAYDQKVRRLAREAELEDYCLEPDEHERLPALLHQLEAERVAVQAKIERFAARESAAGTSLRATVLRALSRTDRSRGGPGTRLLRSALRRLRRR